MLNRTRRRFGKIDHPLDRYSEIVDDLTHDILRGHYRPADRLPRWRELTARYDTTLATVRKALDRLDEYGFIERGGWHGIRVAAYPPHRCHFGLVFPDYGDAAGQFSSHFLTALAQVAGQLHDTRPRWLSVYHGVRGERDEDLQPLANDLNARRVAGLILTERHTAENSRMAALLHAAQVPVVALLTEVQLPSVTRIVLPPTDFLERACAYLRAQGRHRVALVSVAHLGPMMWELAQGPLAAHGLVAQPWWRAEAALQCPGALRPAMQMLWRLPAKNRPDALVITDDNLVTEATAGLVAAGVRVPADLLVVAHANFPLTTASAVPAVRLGFDVRRVLTTCLDVLEQRGRGEVIPEPVIITAEFESEISNRNVGRQFLPRDKKVTQGSVVS